MGVRFPLSIVIFLLILPYALSTNSGGLARRSRKLQYSYTNLGSLPLNQTITVSIPKNQARYWTIYFPDLPAGDAIRVTVTQDIPNEDALSQDFSYANPVLNQGVNTIYWELFGDQPDYINFPFDIDACTVALQRPIYFTYAVSPNASADSVSVSVLVTTYQSVCHQVQWDGSAPIDVTVNSRYPTFLNLSLSVSTGQQFQIEGLGNFTTRVHASRTLLPLRNWTPLIVIGGTTQYLFASLPNTWWNFRLTLSGTTNDITRSLSVLSQSLTCEQPLLSGAPDCGESASPSETCESSACKGSHGLRAIKKTEVWTDGFLPVSAAIYSHLPCGNTFMYSLCSESYLPCDYLNFSRPLCAVDVCTPISAPPCGYYLDVNSCFQNLDEKLSDQGDELYYANWKLLSQDTGNCIVVSPGGSAATVQLHQGAFFLVVLTVVLQLFGI